MTTLLEKLSHSEKSHNRADRPTVPNDLPTKFPRGLTAELLSLLNTIQYSNPLPDNCHELRTSLLTYGLPTVNERDIESMATAIAETIRRHEPRLHHVEVFSDTDADSPAGTQCFLVQAETTTNPRAHTQILAITADRQRQVKEQDLE